jgi:hypothetical protein
MTPIVEADVRLVGSYFKSLFELDKSLQIAAHSVVEHLSEFVVRYPLRVHQTDRQTHVYHHPDPDLEIEFEIKPDGSFSCSDIASGMRRKLAFISYSRKNAEMLLNFREHLRTLEEQGRIEFWVDDEDIEPGDEWREALEDVLRRADAAILFVTQQYLESKFVNETELPVLEERYENNSLSVDGIHVDWAAYGDYWFSKLQALLDPSTPIWRCPPEQRVDRLTEVCRRLRKKLMIGPPQKRQITEAARVPADGE